MIPEFLFVLTLISASPTAADSLEALDREHHTIKADRDALLSQSRLFSERMQAHPSTGLAWRQARNQFALGNLSQGEARNGHFQACIEAADRALALDPQSAIGFFYRGLCRGKQGESQGVWSSLKIIKPFKRDMQAAIQFDPSVEAGGPHRALGKLYMELPGLLGGNLEKSIGHLKEAVRLGPEMGDNYLFLAEAYYKAHRFAPARDVLNILFKNTEPKADRPEVQRVRKRGKELLLKITPYIE